MFHRRQTNHLPLALKTLCEPLHKEQLIVEGLSLSAFQLWPFWCQANSNTTRTGHVSVIVDNNRMFKVAGRCPAMKRSYCSAIQENQEICFHTLPLPSLHEKCSTTYSRTWVGRGREPRRVEGGIGDLGIGGSAPAQKI